MPTDGISLPAWIGRLPRERRKQATIRFLLRAAALYATEHGTLTELSALCGYSRNTLSTVAGREGMSPEMARTVELIVGRQLFPRELLCPRVYDDAVAAR